MALIVVVVVVVVCLKTVWASREHAGTPNNRMVPNPLAPTQPYIHCLTLGGAIITLGPARPFYPDFFALNSLSLNP